MNRGVTEAAEELVNFAWSAVVTDCTESADYLNELVNNLRAALAAEPGAAEWWKPIETAPKDGEPLDLWCFWPESGEEYRTADAHWNGNDWQLGQYAQHQYVQPPIAKFWMRPAAPHQSGESGNG